MKKLIAFCVAFYIFVGYYGSLIPFSVELQYLAIAISVFGSFLSLKHKDFQTVLKIVIFAIIIGFITKFFTLENIYGNYSDYIIAKPFRFASLLVYSFSIAFLFREDKLFLHYLIHSFFIMLLGIFIMSLFQGSFSSSSRFVVGESGNPIWTARAFGFLIIISFYIVKNYFLKFLIVFISLSGILLTQSEGPLFAILVIGWLEFQNRISFNKSLKKIIFVSVCLIGIGLIIFFLDKIDFNGRDLFYIEAFNLILKNPFGNGIGYFALNSSLPYPHNIILEYGLELGIFCALVFIFFTVLVVNKIIFKIHLLSNDMRIIFYLYIFDLINAQFSGDITSPKVLYITFFILYFSINRFRNKNTLVINKS